MKDLVAKKSIAGKYTHFKGKTYDLFCIANDSLGIKYVLYRQCYGDQSFWIRPFDMFFENVTLDNGEQCQRFEPTTDERCDVKVKIEELIKLVEENKLRLVKNSENETLYAIIGIDTTKDYVIIHQINSISSGYLSDFELVRRLGFIECKINNKINLFENKEGLDPRSELIIGNNSREDIYNFINPCSVDLQIASTCYLETRRKSVDPQSVEIISSANELWKPIKTYKSKNKKEKYFKLYPGRTVVTHIKERIKIPDDCAGKIEIKSTFARLSLSITSGDFCNPGYNGYFPLEITNHGNHTIIIHECETMAQLMIVPINDPVIKNYPLFATHINREGYDDGTPFSFWQERSIKSLRENNGTQQIIDLYQKILKLLKSENIKNINDYKDRFRNNFLPYCQKKIGKEEFNDSNKEIPSARKILKSYIKKEQILKILFGIRWAAGVFAIIIAVIPVLLNIYFSQTQTIQNISILDWWPAFVFAVVLLIGSIILMIVKPKTFCTFDNIDIDDFFKED